MRSKNGGDGGTGVYMREVTTSRVTVADRTYSKFYDFYSASPENFGSTHVTTIFRDRSDIVMVEPNKILTIALSMRFICFSVILCWPITFQSSYHVTTDKMQDIGK